MPLTIVTLLLFAPAYLVSRYVVRAASPKLALGVVGLLAVASAFLMPTDSRVPPWAFSSDSRLEMALYLASEFAFFTMGGVAVLLGQRMRGRRA